MSGHSKWATIKHKKAATDAKRGALFTKLGREIMAAAKAGGGNMDANFRLRAAVQKARGMNMPMNNIENAIKKGTGEMPGVTYDDVSFDAYGPGGVAILVEGLTDNKNRTTAEVRSALTRKNGSLAGPGAVSFIFDTKGLITIAKDKISEDDLMDTALEAGAEDINSDGDMHEVTTDVDSFEAVKKALEDKGIELSTAEVTKIPNTTVKVEGSDAKNLLALIEVLEDNEDIQNVYANFDISDEEMDKLTQG